MVITDQAVVEADSLVVTPADELEVWVGAGLAVLPRCQATLLDSNKNLILTINIKFSEPDCALI